MWLEFALNCSFFFRLYSQVWPSVNPTNTISVNEMKRVDDTKFLVLTLSDTLKKGNVYVVKLNYSAQLGDARGFYKYHYNNQGRPE